MRTCPTLVKNIVRSAWIGIINEREAIFHQSELSIIAAGVLQGLDTHHLKNRHEHSDFYPIP